MRIRAELMSGGRENTLSKPEQLEVHVSVTAVDTVDSHGLITRRVTTNLSSVLLKKIPLMKCIMCTHIRAVRNLTAMNVTVVDTVGQHTHTHTHRHPTQPAGLNILRPHLLRFLHEHTNTHTHAVTVALRPWLLCGLHLALAAQ